MDAIGRRGPPRFDMDADTLDDIARYFASRAVQGLVDGFRWEGVVEPLTHGGATWGARAWATGADGVRRQSVYVRASARGEGHLSRYVAEVRVPFVTSPSCELEAFFAKRAVPYLVAGLHGTWQEYRAVARRFDDRYAARSGVHYMNHIDEGVAVLRDLGATERAQRAFCLHPLVQADAELEGSYPRLAELTQDLHVLALAMEYRSTANAYLSHRDVRSSDEVALSPLVEVNDMLRADKIQNAKDFVLHHRETHPRRDALSRYFRTWHARLGVTEADFARYFVRLQATARPTPLPAW